MPPQVPTPPPQSSPTPPPIQPPPPAVSIPPVPPPQPPPPASHFLSGRLLAWIVGGAIFFAILGGVAYAYVQKIGPFANLPYTEDTILAGLIKSSDAIDSAAYELTLSIKIVPREEGALPFTVQVSNEAELREQYQNDYDRAQAINQLLSEIRASTLKNHVYPSTLQVVANSINARGYGSKVSILDPVTRTPYGYRVGEEGAALTVTFETKNAIAAVRRSYQFDPATTLISGQTVTFKNSSGYSYVSVSKEPPKPFLVQIGEYLRYLPTQFSIMGGVKGVADFDNASKWKFNLSGSGDFGDLTYAIDLDALKIDTDYYGRVNKIPSILLSSLSYLKGQWVHISAETATSSSYSGNELTELAQFIPRYEKSYRENREHIQEYYKKLYEIAQAVGIIAFKEDPHSERVGDRLLYRYSLTLRKEAILPFYKKLSDMAKEDPELSRSSFFNDEGVVEYLESDEFSQVYDYLNKYISLTWWVDPQGNLAQSELLFKGIPPDSATPLADKQINVLVHFELSDINKPVSVDRPEGAKEIDELETDVDQNRFNFAPGTTDSVKAYLGQASSGSYSLYEKYGIFSLGACTKKSGTVFGLDKVYSNIALAAGGDASKARCAASGESYAISVPLTTAGYSWCVDSTGDSRQIKGVLSDTTCK